MNAFFRGFSSGFKSLLELPKLTPEILIASQGMLEALHRTLCQKKDKQREGCCVDIPPSVYKRPDPLLYSQSWLMSQGLAVTWDNPDIQLFKGENPVSSFNLLPNQEYNVRVQVWNNSYDAPAAGLPVSLSYLSFGIGTTSTFVDKTFIDLGVKGSSQAPAYAWFKWKTPGAAGHYCLQARIDWFDDANPDNNLGQENTDVGEIQSPAEFTFTVMNNASIDRRFHLEADFYRLPELRQCDTVVDQERNQSNFPSRLAESRVRWQEALNRQRYGNFPVPDNWNVQIQPADFSLAPGEEIIIQVQIEPQDLGFKGQQAVNIHGFVLGTNEDRQLIGGVTLYVNSK